MPYDRINAFGVQHGQVSPAEQFQAQQAEAMRRAQMAALMSGAGGGGRPAQGADQGFEPFPSMVDKPQELHAWSPDVVLSQQRQLNGTKELMGLQGQQAMDLDKQHGQTSLDIVKQQMLPSQGANQREQALFDEQTPIRQMQRQAQQNFLQGSATDDADLLRGAIAMGRDPTPFLQARTQERGYARQDEMAQQGAINSLIAELAKTNPAAAAKLGQSSKALGGVDPSVLQGAFESTGQKPYESISAVMAPELKRMTDFIRSNNWSIAGNQDQLRNLYNSILAKAQTMNPDPRAFRALQEDMKNAMRDALQQNGAIFESAGSDATRRNFGL
jgi:hypothetical protein